MKIIEHNNLISFISLTSTWMACESDMSPNNVTSRPLRYYVHDLHVVGNNQRFF